MHELELQWKRSFCVQEIHYSLGPKYLLSMCLAVLLLALAVGRCGHESCPYVTAGTCTSTPTATSRLACHTIVTFEMLQLYHKVMSSCMLRRVGSCTFTSSTLTWTFTTLHTRWTGFIKINSTLGSYITHLSASTFCRWLPSRATVLPGRKRACARVSVVSSSPQRPFNTVNITHWDNTNLNNMVWSISAVPLHEMLPERRCQQSQAGCNGIHFVPLTQFATMFYELQPCPTNHAC